MSAKPDVRIVLVRPKESRNVGAVCRAMKNMGFRSLRIVMDTLIDPSLARALAHYASDVLENAEVYADLKDALADTVFIAGTTRRRGRDRKYFSLFPEQLAEKVALTGGTVAIVFGNEETGLTDAELALCHVAVTIPSSEGFPSLNLSHAVQVVCYEVFRALAAERRTPFTPIGAGPLDSLVSVITASLKAIGFFKLVPPDQMGRFFRDILGRAGLSVDEARRLEVVFRKIGGLVTKRGIDPDPNPP